MYVVFCFSSGFSAPYNKLQMLNDVKPCIVRLRQEKYGSRAN